jgi:penicillin-binding protein 1A
MNRMLQAVVNDPQGTGRYAKFDNYAIAGKTGTTNDYRDAWFVGFTSHLCTGVWIGNDDNSPMRRVGGGTLPVNVFREFMRRTHEYLSMEPHPLP